MRYVDELVRVEFDLKGTQSLEQTFAHQRMRAEQVQWLIEALRQAEVVLQEYLLSPDGLVLNPAYLYMEGEQHHLRFCYQLGKRGYLEEQIQPLLQFILDHVDYQDQQAVTLAYALYHMENEGGNLLERMVQFAEKSMNPPESTGGEAGISTEEEEQCIRHAARADKRSGLFYRLFHRESKRQLLLEQSRELAEKETGYARV
jgi:hypothetical protein